jgi:hypothetical protein
MFSRCRMLLVGAFSLFALPAAAQQQIGTAHGVTPAAHGSVAGTLASGAGVHADETIGTDKAGKAGLRFHDQSNLDIGPNSSVKLNKFIYDPNRSGVSDGDIDKLTRFREVFEDDRIYGQVFSENRLKAHLRKIVLCYKVQFRLGRLSYDIVDKGANKYAYVLRSRNLLWRYCVRPSSMIRSSKSARRNSARG